LDVSAGWRQNVNAKDVKPSHDAMRLREARPQSIRKLEWGEQQDDAAENCVWQ
jgi:hypothetical protein